jgi:hypothetical protein
LLRITQGQGLKRRQGVQKEPDLFVTRDRPLVTRERLVDDAP